MYNYSVDPCGPIYVTVGDGGRCTRDYTLHDKGDSNTERSHPVSALMVHLKAVCHATCSVHRQIMVERAQQRL